MDNHVSIVGTLVRDPTLTEGEVPNIRFTVKIHREWLHKKSGENRERDSFYDVICYNDLARGCAEYPLERGDEVIVLGKLNQRTMVGDDGHKTSVLDIAGDHVGLSMKNLSAKDLTNESDRARVSIT